MHGRLKVKTSEERANEKRLEKEKKLAKFHWLCTNIQQNRTNEVEPLLAKTAEILIANQDVYTFWNIRKEVLLEIKQKNSEEAEELFKKELVFLNECLRSSPKSYGSWQHRCFVMEAMNNPNWKFELDLCSKFLEIDDRNFHCWDYRRFVVEKSKESLESEFDFTTNKIETNFSNFSSWHYRSNILSKIHSTSDDLIGQSVFNSELGLVENALFTDPDDQSGWFYHRWLLNKKSSFVSIERLFVDNENMKIVILLSSPLQVSDATIKMFVDEDGEGKPLNWETANKRKFCRLMVVKFNHEDLVRSEKYKLRIEASGSCFHGNKCTIVCEMDDETPFWISGANVGDNPYHLNQFLDQHWNNLKELHNLEPVNKWILLALISSQHSNKNEYLVRTLNYFKEIVVVDPLRVNYYGDLVSNLKIKMKLNELDDLSRSINLSDLSLSSASCLERLCLMKSVNLSNNDLTSIDDAYFLQSVEVLILGHNKLNDCSGLSNLEELTIIDLSCNDLKTTSDLSPLKSCPKLETLIIKGNPMTSILDHEREIRKLLPNLKFLQ